jgi:hypothetical protein
MNATQLSLLEPVPPTLDPDIDWAEGTFEDDALVHAEADLVLASPPWGKLPDDLIAEGLDNLFAPRMVLWMPNSKCDEWAVATALLSHLGHWRWKVPKAAFPWNAQGQLRVYERGRPWTHRSSPFNMGPGFSPAHRIGMLVQRFCPPGGLVLDPWGGADVAGACRRLGRRYIGRVASPALFASGLAQITQTRYGE